MISIATLYSTNCPRCKVLAAKLEEAGIPFNISEDIDEMIDRGFRSAPVLEVDGKYMDFSTAVRWLEERTE